MSNETNSTLSIMEQIQLIIRPPPNEEEKTPARSSQPRHTYYKRPGRGHNHDLCDACEEGGDLLCCDRCPSSFHLQCHDPPLNSEDIPIGQWLCHSCRMSLKTTPASKASSVERNATDVRSTTPLADLDTVPLKVRALRKRSNSHSSSMSSDLSNMEKLLPKLPMGIQQALDPNKKPTPFDELIKAASVLNPKQFMLPRELEIHTQFPGNDKIEPLRKHFNGNKKPGVRSNSKPYELDANGCVPLPACICFYCNKSCKKYALIRCDYCSLHYHADCLDPPMTALPSGLWMCPNHVENFVDQNLLTSISSTERVRLWNKFSQPFDEEAVKMEFIRRVHMANPPFRTRVPLKARETIDVPAMVKYHYENPPVLLPSLRHALRYDMVKQRKFVAATTTTSGNALQLMFQSMEQDSKAFEDAKLKCSEAMATASDEQTLQAAAADDDDDDDDVVQLQKADSTVEIHDSSDKLDKKKRNKSVAAKLDDSKLTTTTTNAQAESSADTEDDEEEHETEQANAQIDAELACLDVDLIKKLAFQRLQQLVEQQPEIVSQYQQRTANKRIRELFKEEQNIANNTPTVLPSTLLAGEDVRKMAIMFTSDAAAFLTQSNNNDAEDATDQLHPALATASAIMATEDEVQKYAPRQRTDAEKAFEIASRLQLQLLNRRTVRARAVLTPLGDMLQYDRWFSKVDLNDSYFMRYRKLLIGCGSGVDVNLWAIGACCRISPKHATIFYDEATKTYELINYSEHGTMVNGLLYSCDFPEYEPTPVKKVKNEDLEVKQHVRALVDKKRGIKRQYYVLDESARMAAPAKPHCNCTTITAPPMLAGAWEGTAILTHGSLINIGCLSFVFSIPDVDSFNGQG